MRNLRSVLSVSMLISFSLLLTGAALGEEVRPGIQIVHGINAVLPNDDLKPLKRIIGDAPVVALGESVHTSGGYSRLKYRIFRYLVEEMDFRVLAFEVDRVSADRVDQYVQTCDGTAEEAISELYGVWKNESLRDLVTWMCLWNRRHPYKRVHFYGFDTRQPDADSRALTQYLELVGRESDDPRVQGIERCSLSIFDEYYAEDDYRECARRLDQLANFFDRREENLVRWTSREDFEWAQIHLAGLRAWQDELYLLFTPEWYLSSLARDEAMVYLFAAIRDLRFPGVKTAIWAHNTHIEEDAAATDFGMPTMGTFLADALGDDYITFGLVGWDVHIDWGRIGCGPLSRNFADDSVEQLLHELGERYLLVDLDFRGSDRRFFEPGQSYRVGSYYMVPREQFNGLFFLNHSPRMKPLGWDPCM
ncbi:MAG: erythromycin esterase family protein [bacterium]|nr:erythromycin esterase family protein [bacterium]